MRAEPLLKLLRDTLGEEALEQLTAVHRQGIAPSPVAYMVRQGDGIAPDLRSVETYFIFAARDEDVVSECLANGVE